MAFRVKNPNVLARDLVASKKSRNENNVQKPRGYVLTPSSLVTGSNKENAQPWQTRILADHDRAVEKNKEAIKDIQEKSVTKLGSLGTVRSTQNAKKTPPSDKTPTTATPPLNFAGAVRSNLGHTTTSTSSTYNRVSPTSNHNYLPTLGDYTRVLVSWSKSKDPNAGKRAQEVLQQMLDRFQAKQSNIRPDACCYNMVIRAYNDDAERAEQVLRLMWDDYKTGGNTLAEPNARVYTSILHVWGHSKAPHAPERCETILQQMHDMHNSGRLQDCKPDLYAYTAVLYSWKESQSQDSGRRAEMLFRRMMTRFQGGDESLRPDDVAYTNVLHAYIGGTNAPRAEDILWEMVGDYLNGNNSAKPSLRLCNAVLSVWSVTEAPHAPERAEAMINRIHELCNAGALDFKPNSYTYSLMLKSWAVCGRNDSAERAQAALSWMKGRFNAGDRNAQLSAIQYTTCIGLWVSAGNMTQAELLWTEMYKDYINGNSFAEPDVVACNRILTGWARGTDAAAVDHAEVMLEQMWKLHNHGSLPNIRPSVATYNSVIFCWKHSHRPYAPTRVDSLLHEMSRFYKTGQMLLPPNHVSIRTALKTWKQSSYTPAKAKRISMLERELHKRFGIVADGGSWKGSPRGGYGAN